MKTSTSIKKLLLLLLLSFGFCATSFSQNDHQIQDEIISRNKEFIKIYSESGGGGVAELYSKNAVVMPPNSGFVEGNEAIFNFWKGAFNAGIKKVNLETVGVASAGLMANETGKYKLYGADDKEIDSGKYLVFWKKEDGKWKLFRDIWNSSLPGK